MNSTANKLWRLMTPTERRDALALFGLMLVGMLFETLSVGLVVPALALMSRADFMTHFPVVASWLTVFGHPTREVLVVAGMLALVGVYAAKTVFLTFLTLRQSRFVFRLQSEVSQRLFLTYLRQSYSFHLRRNSAQLIRNALGEVDILTQNGVLQGLIFLTESSVMLGILALLVYVQPLGALLAGGTLTLFGGIFYWVIRARTLRWGETRHMHDGMRVQHLQQGLGGVKDVKLLGREDEFVAQYELHARGAARVGELQHTLTQAPRFVLEFLAVIALAVLVAVMIGQGRPFDELLPTLGLFGAAAFRILPSATRIINAAQVVRNSVPAVNVLYHELCELDQHVPISTSGAVEFRHSLTLEDVRFQYPETDTPALSDLRLSISSGETIGIVGGSGAGKSTLVDLVLGLLAPCGGVIRVDGLDIQRNLRGWQDRIGYVPQTIFLTDDTLRRNIAFGIADAEIDESAVWRAAQLAQIDRFIRELPQNLDTKVGERGVRLSGGQLQRIGIARALYHDPDVLILDEATSSLDTATELGVMDSVRALHGEKTIIIVAHRLSTVEKCDRLYRLEAGRIVATGEAAQVIATVRGAAI
jgi:ABC-type multidrug transport system fused ATPase/permease subunit